MAAEIISSRHGHVQTRSTRNFWTGCLAGLALGLATFLIPLPALAQGECTCHFSQALIPDIKAAGRIESVRNTVLVTTPQGSQAARAGQTLAIADSVQTGLDGNAQITIGTGCRIELAPRSTLNIWPVDNGYCVAAGRAAPDAPGGAVDSSSILPAPSDIGTAPESIVALADNFTDGSASR